MSLEHIHFFLFAQLLHNRCHARQDGDFSQVLLLLMLMDEDDVSFFTAASSGTDRTGMCGSSQ
jgi:hypothetical protein